ncbi:hypothetical protein M0R45_015476 [Rubus argutus]|uniref:Transmembrane protein n=1 Tax=Rubus argutus TaxID=59490 RepID=A0AAW1XRS4_RUBAR
MRSTAVKAHDRLGGSGLGSRGAGFLAWPGLFETGSGLGIVLWLKLLFVGDGEEELKWVIVVDAVGWAVGNLIVVISMVVLVSEVRGCHGFGYVGFGKLRWRWGGLFDDNCVKVMD